jgi:hypothetical protein
MTAGRGTPKKRNYVRFDRYALFDIGRANGLNSDDCYLLDVITRLADFRSAVWCGSKTELASYGLMTRRAASKAFARLVERNLVEEIIPFGPNSPGMVRVLCYADLTLDGSPELVECLSARLAQIRASQSDATRADSQSTRAELALNSRSIRADQHEFETPTSDNARTRGSEAAWEKKGSGSSSSEVESNGLGDNCTTCGGPMKGHLYNDHEPTTAPRTLGDFIKVATAF